MDHIARSTEPTHSIQSSLFWCLHFPSIHTSRWKLAAHPLFAPPLSTSPAAYPSSTQHHPSDTLGTYTYLGGVHLILVGGWVHTSRDSRHSVVLFLPQFRVWLWVFLDNDDNDNDNGDKNDGYPSEQWYFSQTRLIVVSFLFLQQQRQHCCRRRQKQGIFSSAVVFSPNFWLIVVSFLDDDVYDDDGNENDGYPSE